MKTNTLIIGSSSGIGLEATKFFLKKSHNVIGISRRNNNIKSKKFRHINFDLNNFQDYDQLYSNIYNKFGPINNLLFSAGVQFIRPSSIISANDIKKIFNINLKSPILFSKFISNNGFSNDVNNDFNKDSNDDINNNFNHDFNNDCNNDSKCDFNNMIPRMLSIMI